MTIKKRGGDIGGEKMNLTSTGWFIYKPLYHTDMISLIFISVRSDWFH